MARPGVTYSEVANAVQQIIASGKSPTIELVRGLLGTGSNSTLGAHLRTWKSKQDHTQQIASKEHLPESLIAALKGVWDGVMDQADEKIEAIQAETQQVVDTLKQENQRLQQSNAQWQQQHQQTKEERDGLQHECSTISQLLAEAKIDIAALTEKISGLECQHQEKQERIDELHRLNQQVQANLEHYRNASLEQRLADQQRHEQQQRQLEMTLQQVSSELMRAQQEKAGVFQQYQEMVFDLNNVKMQFNKLETQHQTVSERLADTLSELAKRTQAQQHWQEQYQALQITYQQQAQALAELITQHAIQIQQGDLMKNELNELREQNKMLAHEKWTLGQEKAQLYGQLKQLESV